MLRTGGGACATVTGESGTVVLRVKSHNHPLKGTQAQILLADPEWTPPKRASPTTPHERLGPIYMAVDDAAAAAALGNKQTELWAPQVSDHLMFFGFCLFDIFTLLSFGFCTRPAQ